MSFRRVVVAMGAPGAVAVTTAVDLARALEAELVGLFVEDVELFDLAALPFAGEVGYPSAARRALDVAALERALRAQAGRLRQDLTARLAGVSTKWTFEVVRGRVAVALAATASGQDLVVLPLPLASRGRAVTRVQVARAYEGLRAPLLLVDESARQRRAVGVIAPADIAPASIVDASHTISPGSKPLHVGTSDVGEASNAFIGELVYFGRALTDPERDAVIAYLRTLWSP